MARVVSDNAEGFSAQVVMRLSGVTYRQLDRWAKAGILTPSIASGTGRGNFRLYSFADIVVLRAIAKLRKAGVPLASIRAADLRSTGDEINQALAA